MVYILVAIVLVLTELFYIRLVDNTSFFSALKERRKEERPVWSGSGLLFYLGMVIFSVLQGFPYPWFFVAITLLAVVGLWNTIRPLSRFIQHIALWASLLLMQHELNLYNDYLCCQVGCILLVSVVIMYVFRSMDGVNRILGGYSFVVLLVLGYINSRMIPFMDGTYLQIAIITAFILCFFNLKFRMRAFCGEAGSGMLGIIVLFALGKLILLTNDASYLIVLLIYAVDSLLTLLYRIIRRENIFQTEGKHMYQFMVTHLNIPQFVVSAIYAAAQSLVITGYFLLFSYRGIYFFCMTVFLCVLYVFFERRINKLDA